MALVLFILPCGLCLASFWLAHLLWAMAFFFFFFANRCRELFKSTIPSDLCSPIPYITWLVKRFQTQNPKNLMGSDRDLRNTFQLTR